jgi:hypothetical protein
MQKRHAKSPTTPKPRSTKATSKVKAAQAVSDNGHHENGVSEEAIRARAYEYWESSGRPEGDGLRFWLEAEQELKNGK